MKYTKAEVEVIILPKEWFMIISSGKICGKYDIIQTAEGNTYACFDVDDGYYISIRKAYEMLCHDVEGFAIATTLYCTSITHHHDEIVP